MGSTSSATPTLHLVDASVYVFRAYFSVAPEFNDVDGKPVHAVYGFLGFLLNLLEQARPTHLAVAFDQSLTTSFRNRIYPAYKANRELPPPDLDLQFRYCREFVQLMGLSGMAHDEFEADDLIGSAMTRARGHGFRGVIVSADKDLSQLIHDGDLIWDFARNLRYGGDGVMQRLGVRPDQVVDLLALTGDAVDNIPGVPGIGPKTACALLAHFGSLAEVLARVDEIPYLRIRGAAAAAAKIRANRELALMSQQLTAIAMDAPTPAHPDLLRPQAPDHAGLDGLLERLKFGPLTRRRVREYTERFGN